MNNKYPIPVVGALIINEKNELFLMKSSGKFGNEWIVPGGKVNFGVNLIDALKREIKEETNIEILNPRFLGIQEYIKKGNHYIFIEFIGYSINSQVKLNNEAIDFGWFSKKKLKNIKIAEPTLHLIDTYLIPLEII
ncbi:MAG: NUDIX hydrolase [Patescibacteria group bacterium]|nr:NUDIX hydrolase [Patescibacteria group bacterium]